MKEELKNLSEEVLEELTEDLKDEAMKVYRALQGGTLEEARAAVGRIVGRDTAELTPEGVTKAAVEATKLPVTVKIGNQSINNKHIPKQFLHIIHFYIPQFLSVCVHLHYAISQ